MRRALLATFLLTLCAFASADDKSVRDALAATDPFAPGGPAAALVGADAATEAAVRELARSDADTTVRDRAARLALAWDLCAKVREGPGKFALTYWLALDELDAEYAGEARSTLLGRALPAAEAHDAALKKLSEARAVAQRFCLEWNEIDDLEGPTAKAHAELRAALEAAGPPAGPYLLSILAVPPQAVFTVMDPKRGNTARQQVRALFALGFLKAKECVPYLVFHCRGPSYTSSTTAQGQVAALTGQDFGKDDEEKQVAAIEAWWTQHRADYAIVLDHFVRHTLRWTRVAIAGDAEAREWSVFGPMGIARVTGRKFEFDPKAELADRVRQLDAFERERLSERAKPTPR